MEIVCLDSSVLIDYYRKKEKSKTFLFNLSGHHSFAISTVVKYEILRGDKKDTPFWNSLFSTMKSLPFDDQCAFIASELYKTLKNKNQLIGMDDILIGATALRHNLKLATFNRKDFERIEGLTFIAL